MAGRSLIEELAESVRRMDGIDCHTLDQYNYICTAEYWCRAGNDNVHVREHVH